MTVCRCLLLPLNKFHNFSNVFIVDFEQRGVFWQELYQVYKNLSKFKKTTPHQNTTVQFTHLLLMFLHRLYEIPMKIKQKQVKWSEIIRLCSTLFWRRSLLMNISYWWTFFFHEKQGLISSLWKPGYKLIWFTR